ncbi:iron-containing alcohol dehydrogenase [bacterium]|nr:iron-containing alcohol dehydrogenase [bacterium]
MTSFNLVLPRKIVFGPGRFAEIASLAAPIGKRAILVTGRGSLEKSGRLKAVQERLDAAGVAWRHVTASPEPTVEQVVQLLSGIEDFAADLVIAIGGGSTIDTGKALAALIANGGEPMDYLEGVGRGRAMAKPALPIIAVPTTAGTGAEATKNSVIGDEARTFKKSIRDDSMMPMVALIDPEFLAECPPPVAAMCGMDATSQLIESFVSRGGNPLTDTLAREGLAAAGALIQFLRDPKDAVAAESMAMASMLGGVCLANAGLGSIHALASPIGAFFPSPHGAVCAALMPAAIELNCHLANEAENTELLDKYAMAWQLLTGWSGGAEQSADPFGGESVFTGMIDTTFDASKRLVRFLAQLKKAMRIPGLAHWGVTENDFGRIIDNAGPGNLKNNAVELDRDGLAWILESSL